MPAARIFLFPPVFTHGALFDYRLLGVQHWLADTFTHLGLPAMSSVMPALDDRTQLIATTTPSDADLRSTLLEQRAPYGLLTVFAVLGSEPQLAVARLVEAKRGYPLRNLLRLALDGDELPAAAHRVLTDVLARLRVVEVQSGWTDAFGTGSVTLAGNYLTALGCYSSCDLGMPVDQAEVALRAAISGIGVGVPAHVELFPRLVESLRATGTADEETLRAAVLAAVEAVGTAPPSWADVVRRYGTPTGPALLN